MSIIRKPTFGQVISPTQGPTVETGALPWTAPGTGPSAGGAASVALETLVAAAVETGTIYGQYYARSADFTPGTWTDVSGNGNDLTNSTHGSYNATGLGTAPGIDFNGTTHYLDSASINLSGVDSYALICAMKDSTATQSFFANVGNGTSYVTLRVNGSAGEIGVQARNPNTTRADSSTSYPMSTAGVISGLWDSSLVTSECVIRHNGSDVTASRAVDGANATGALSNGPITVGALFGGSSFWAGSIGALVVLGFPSGIVTSEVGAVEALLSGALSEGSWA